MRSRVAAARAQRAVPPGIATRADQARGRWGEDLAASWYLRQGCQILERNWRGSAGEVDLIARFGDVIMFVEVKTRRTDAFGTPGTAVDWRKQRRIRFLAAEYLERAHTHGVEVRFDVVAVTGSAVAVVESAF